MIPCRKNDTVERGLARLTTAYASQPNIRALLTVYLRQIQQLEDATWDVMTSRLLGEVRVPVPLADDGCGDVDMTGATMTTIVLDASDSHLDVVGDNVGEPRYGRTDEEYRIAIRARVAASRSDGLAEDLIRVLKSLPPSVEWSYTDEGLLPATFRAEAYALPGPLALVRMLGRARAGGVRGVLQFSELPLTESFLFSSVHGASSGDTRGFASRHGATSTPSRLVGVITT